LVVKKKNKLLIYIVAYEAERHIRNVLDRIPLLELANVNYTILISDDASQDKTSDIVREYQASHQDLPIILVTQDKNLQYGGNQKYGYNYAIENNFDMVVLLHGDGQYAPEVIPKLMKPIFDSKAEIVLGSRMLKENGALKGGMPFYKFIGNKIITYLQNLLLGVKISEFHTGLRAYSVKALKKIPFKYNENGFSFDTDILIQSIDNKCIIREIAIPTHYGNEVCHVNGIKYAIEVIWATLMSRMQRLHVIKYRKFTYK
jgi:glycosyltransferase involved in cell wall biosynthesis